MLKKAGFLLILSALLSHFAYSQYDDDAPSRDSGVSDSEIVKPSFVEKLVPGMEFMLNAGGGAVFAELSPFIAYNPVKPILLGLGVHGSFLGAGQFGNYAYFGGHAFARITIADMFFIHGEYRLMNGSIPGVLKERKWVTSPIAGLGIMYGSQSYLLIGYAMNADFQNINPLEGVVYRLGVYF
jgi:hypothetical protein